MAGATATLSGVLPDGTGWVYEGAVVDGFTKHGQGVQRFSDGSIYEGEFADGECEGSGKMCWPSGEVYNGEWTRGTFDGRGSYAFATGGKYVGQWVDGKMHGKGRLTIKIFAEDGSSTEVTQEGTWDAGVYTPPVDESAGKPGSAKKKKKK